MNKDLQKHIEKELIESFKIFYFSLNQHLPFEEVNEKVKSYIDEIKDLTSITDDVDLKVKFVVTLPNGEDKHSTYQPLQLFVQNGVTLREDIERFQVSIRAEFRKNEIKYQSTDEFPFFKSEIFIIKDNIKSVQTALMKDSVEQKKSKNLVLVDAEDLREFSNNRIRIGEVKNLEI